jgi:N-acetylmuramoyl-L-alanine amidase
MSVTVILDAGHGGMIDGVYQTAGKRSPIWDDGSQYFEGVGNRQIVSKLTDELNKKGISVFNANDSEIDMKLSERVSIINKEIKSNPDSEFIGISVHSNGFHDARANGWSVHVSSNCSVDSLIMAEMSSNKMKKEFPDQVLRGVKKDNFYILKNTICPFILTENFFMTNEKECKEILITQEGQDKIVKLHFDFICSYLGV